MNKPLIIVPSCTMKIDTDAYYLAQMKYVDAVSLGAGGMPLVLPACAARTDWEAVLDVADGILLTGSPSNVHPSLFGEDVLNPALPLDEARDALTIPLIRKAVDRRIPLMAICRGTQEINVALGGSLHQAVHQVPGMMDHRDDDDDPLDVQYGPAHRVSLTPGGIVSAALGGRGELMVNSLHGQGVARLAPGLRVEAVAEDGLVEAFSAAEGAGFMLAVQWHPEWKITENPDSMSLLAAFGQACRQYQQHKKEGRA
ncbi:MULTISPECIES: gamma-glutamyl-gamma-aminobutyrate hydrolase family protein [Herbaspirillum]|uniref:gamma-glutamyl-gamma-aminobutyrate hydrolase family protein n=1 Tax=Herbaspirillum TaxID=963 RepID=UPI00034559D7|nr:MULTISPECIES: gamma-glutamyl-gamma-aminobutyrate hydrolase family protein [Herbaspirillum]MCP1572688.1 putative glutamine amidotransferase [Herbaspirillum rubrisubalbicans]